MTEVVHGYQHTDMPCPFCGNSYGMRERVDETHVLYRCWCGATVKQEWQPAGEDTQPHEVVSNLPCDLCDQPAMWGLIGEAGDFLLCDHHHDRLSPEAARGYHRVY